MVLISHIGKVSYLQNKFEFITIISGHNRFL